MNVRNTKMKYGILQFDDVKNCNAHIIYPVNDF